MLDPPTFELDDIILSTRPVFLRNRSIVSHALLSTSEASSICF